MIAATSSFLGGGPVSSPASAAAAVAGGAPSRPPPAGRDATPGAGARGPSPGAESDAVGFGPPPAFPSRRQPRGTRTRTILAVSAAATGDGGAPAGRAESSSEDEAGEKPSQMIHRRQGGEDPQSSEPRGKSGEEGKTYDDALLLASMSDVECSPKSPTRQEGGAALSDAFQLAAEECHQERSRSPSSFSSTNSSANSHAPTPRRSNVNTYAHHLPSANRDGDKRGEYQRMPASSSLSPTSLDGRDPRVTTIAEEGVREGHYAPLQPHFSRGTQPPGYPPGHAPPASPRGGPAPYIGVTAVPPVTPGGYPYGPSYPPHRPPMPTVGGRAPAAPYPRHPPSSHPPPSHGSPPAMTGHRRGPPSGGWSPYHSSSGPEMVRSNGDQRRAYHHAFPTEPPSPGYPAESIYGAPPQVGEGYYPSVSSYNAISHDDGSPGRASQPMHPPPECPSAVHTPPRGHGLPVHALQPTITPTRGQYDPYHTQQGQAPPPLGYAPPPSTPGGYPYPHHPYYGRHTLSQASMPDPYEPLDHAEVPAAVSHESAASEPRRHPGVPPPPPLPSATTYHQFRKGGRSVHSPPVILRRKFSWRNYPELEDYLRAHRAEYLRHSALNYTAEQKHFNNRLTEGLLELAARLNYVFDEGCFHFVAVRDRIRCYYKSYVQSAKKRGVVVGFGKLPAQGERERQGGHYDTQAEMMGGT